MNFKGRTSTEVSGMTAIAVAVSLALEGMFIPAGVALVIGVGLLAVYEYLGIGNLGYSEEEIEETAKEVGETVEEEVDSFQG